MGYDFVQNRRCEFFPCHATSDPENFNCLFCFCPLYPYDRCGGHFSRTADHLKDCSDCLFPHVDYPGVMNRLKLFQGL